jgi:hypothetical protein
MRNVKCCDNGLSLQFKKLEYCNAKACQSQTL